MLLSFHNNHAYATQWYFSLLVQRKVPKRKDTPMSAEGLSHSLRWARAKLADKQQSAQTSPHLNRFRSWTLHPAPIGEKGHHAFH